MIFKVTGTKCSWIMQLLFLCLSSSTVWDFTFHGQSHNWSPADKWLVPCFLYLYSSMWTASLLGCCLGIFHCICGMGKPSVLHHVQFCICYKATVACRITFNCVGQTQDCSTWYNLTHNTTVTLYTVLQHLGKYCNTALALDLRMKVYIFNSFSVSLMVQ